MNIYFFPKIEEIYSKKIRYVVDLFFSTYGLDYRIIESFDQLPVMEGHRPDLFLLYGDGENYQDLKEKIPPGCHLLFVSQLFHQVFEQGPPEVKRLKREGTDFSVPILYVYPTSEQKCSYQVEEKSGKQYPGIIIEKSEEQMRIACYADLFASSFYFLTLQEENQGKKERFLAKGSWREKENLHQIPLVNHYFKILFDLIQLVAKEGKIPLIYKRPWSSGSDLAVALTHDVDILGQWSLYILFRVWVLLKKGNLKVLRRMLSKLPGFLFKGGKSLLGVKHLLEEEKSRGYYSTFFFIAGKPNLKTILGSDITYSIKKVRPVADQIKSSKGEVGLHGSRSSYLEKENLREEKEKLDKLLSSSCVGIRQHFLYLNVPETWRFQNKSGFLYDCTLGYPDRSGFRSGFALPFRPYDLESDEEIEIWEINTNVMDQTYDKYDPKTKEEIKKEIEKLVGQIESAGGGLLTLLWHTNVLEEFGFPDFMNLYSEFLEYLFNKKAFVSTGENIFKFWKARKEVKLIETKAMDNLWQWRYQAISPITDLTFCIDLPNQSKLRLKIDGAEALIQWEPSGALITFPKLNQKQSFQISLIREES